MNERSDTKITILCVDDTPANLFLLVELLKGTYRVKTATTGTQALQIAAATPPDLILLDVMMPGMDGYEVCRRLKEDAACRDIPILFLTARTHVEEEVSRRVTQLHGMQAATIHVITTLAEFRDEETGNHIRRTQEYMRLIVDEMSRFTEHADALTADRRVQIVNSAPLHDVGKVAIPDTILLKPGRLTTEEFEIMKTHSIRGDEILSRAMNNLGDTGGFLETARQIARSHHERWDGSGYPDGLVAAAIPLPARMMAVADVYDAVRSERPYKRGMSHDEALAIVRQGRGSHFDPKIADVFVSFDRQVQEISEQWADRA